MKWETTSIGRGMRLLIPVLVMLTGQQAFAVGTPAGDIVSNTASVDYSVASVPQDRIDSLPAEFTVDRLVDFTLQVTDAVSSPVTPGGTGTIASLLLTNIGNAAQDFSLAAINFASDVNGVTDTFDMDTPITVYADLDGSGDLSVGDTEFVEALSADPTGGANQIGLLIVADAPSTPTPANGTGATVELTVVAVENVGPGNLSGDAITEDNGPDVIGGVAQIVIGTETLVVLDGFVISAPDITVTKVSVVIDDPVNGGTNPKAIPGATIQYTITAVNAGSENATGVGFIDDLATLPVTLATGGYGGGSFDAEVWQNGALVLQCVVDANDATTVDGCGIFGDEVRILPAALTLDNSGGPLSEAFARFQVTID